MPWRIASALRATAKEWNILIPFHANSAATLLALGADQIVLGRNGELGPIDPILQIQRMVNQPGQSESTLVQDTVNVEDIMAYLRFVKNEVGLSDQAALSSSLANLAGRLDPVGLGSAHRTRSHIRDVAYRMLTSQRKPPSERVMETIVATLAERVYAHGHAIAFKEAKDIGLPVVQATGDTDANLWALLNAYEADLKLREPLDPAVAVAQADRYVEASTVAVVETAQSCFEYKGDLEVRAKRAMPPQLNVSVAINIQLPANLDPANLPPDLQALIQAALQQAQQALPQQAQQAVQQAMAAQATLVGAEVGMRGFRWVRSD